MLDRETRREKIVEARKRERRVKGKARGCQEDNSNRSSQSNRPALPFANVQEDPQLVDAERHFFTTVQPVCKTT